VVDINKGVRPQSLLQFLARNYGAGLLQKDRQHLERLPGQFQSQPCLAQFLRLKVNFKRGKANSPGWCRPGLASLGCLNWPKSNTDQR
jgi:hypothetical protein